MGGTVSPSRLTPETPNYGGTSAQASPIRAAEDANASDRAHSPSALTQPPRAATRPAWVRSAVTVIGILILALIVVFAARWARTLPAVQDFLTTYPGHSTLPENAPEGFPAWMGWQHYLNMFFLVLVVRTGLQVRREKRPPGYWKPKKNSFFSPKGNTPSKVSLSQWLHQVLDVLWVANGAVFIALLAATGHWMRIVPTSWDVFPNIVSTAVQYASLHWPTENGWVHYNALQMVAYFLIVYVAAPLAILTGWRMSTWWPAKATTLNRIYPMEVARGLHFPVMLFFVGFTVVHVFLVFFTGALRNLNHIYSSRDIVDWWGLVIFLASLLLIAVGWYLTKPVFSTHLATRMGDVTKN